MKDMNTRILLADDHELVLRGLRTLLEAQPGFEICGEAANGRAAVKLATELQPDVVIMDIGMPEMNGIEATGRIVRAAPKVAVLVLSMHQSDQFVREVLAVGARGYMLKSDASTELVGAIRALAGGGTFFSPVLAKAAERTGIQPKPKKPGRRAASGLTQREREILQLLAEGSSNKATASSLGISVKTVETHRARIMDKLGVKSLAELVRYAVRNHIIEP
jgi:DNA-binding NarL/FixJ family response regulator